MPPSGALLLFALCAPLRAGQVDAPVVEEVRPVGTASLAGSAPAPLALTIPSLSGAPSAAPALLAPAAAPSALAAPAAPMPAAPSASAAAPVPAAEAPPGQPSAPPAAAQTAGAAPAKAPALAAAKAFAAPSAVDGQDAGGLFFDQAASHDQAPAPSSVASALWGRLKSGLSLGETFPASPGKAGDAVRIGGVKTTLAKRIGGGSSTVWLDAQELYAVKIRPPVAPGTRDEAALLRAAARTDIPVARLIESSRDGTVLVKEYLNGENADALLARGPFTRSQKEGWAELAAKLIKNGASADLSGGNLVWQKWRTRWMIADGGGLADAGPREVLRQLLSPEALTHSGVDPAAFLAGLRGRLGPDSAAWAKTLAALRAAPELSDALAALRSRDAALPPAPRVAFGPAPKGPKDLDDRVVSYGELVRRLGWDPLREGTFRNLHADDPGKLNTEVLSVQAPGKTPVVVKKASWGVIRNEMALRRLARRFFGPSFRVPAALAVERGRDSFMVMEHVDAGPSFAGTLLDPSQRAAAALFIHTFGVGDVNAGNVLAARDGGPPWLIDFEQAMGRAAPVADRVPDEGIAQEMPWLSRREVNRVEDFQPAVRAWRALFDAPESQASVAADLRAAGFAPAEIPALLAVFRANAADLDWTLQNDVDFVNRFAERNSAAR